jgi:predicted amidohydrolase
MIISRRRVRQCIQALAVTILITGILAMSDAQQAATEADTMDQSAGNVVRVAVCQTFCIDSDREGNLRRIEYAVEEAARKKAQLACFPETAVLGWVNPRAHQLAEQIPGAISRRICELARKHKLMICIGLSEKDGEKLYDSAILVGSDGRILDKHRKVNTLVELLDPPYARGTIDEIHAVETPIGRVGMLICADTFKEELVQRAGEQKPDLLLVPYGWAADMDAWPQHGKSLAACVTAAAKRAGCPVVGTDLVGVISAGPWKGKTYGGQSVVADAAGNVLGILRDRDADVRVFDLPLGSKGATK